MIDDTFSSNLRGRANARCASSPRPAAGGASSVTPGHRRARRAASSTRTSRSARRPGKLADTVVIVGATNRSALRSAAPVRPTARAGRGAAPGTTPVAWVAGPRRAEATRCCTRTTCPTTTLDPRCGRRRYHDQELHGPDRRLLRRPVSRARHQHPHRPAGLPGCCTTRASDVVGPLLDEDGRVVPRARAASRRASFVQGPPPERDAAAPPGRAEGGFVEDSRKQRPRSCSMSVVNCCHGGPGENGTLQAAFDLAGIRYTGPSAAGAALGMDKLATAAVARAAGVAVERPVRHARRARRRRRGSRPVHREAAARRVVDRHRGGRPISTTAHAGSSTRRCTSPTARSSSRISTAGSTSTSRSRTHPDVELSPIEKPRARHRRVYSYQEKYLSSGRARARARAA